MTETGNFYYGEDKIHYEVVRKDTKISLEAIRLLTKRANLAKWSSRYILISV